MENKEDILKNLQDLVEECHLLAKGLSRRPEMAASYLYTVAEKLSSIGNELRVSQLEKGNGSELDSPLSPRETEVLTLAAKGQPTKEIAYLLNISMRTVQFHMSSIFKKLEVSSRTEAVAKALEENLLSKA